MLSLKFLKAFWNVYKCIGTPGVAVGNRRWNNVFSVILNSSLPSFFIKKCNPEIRIQFSDVCLTCKIRIGMSLSIEGKCDESWTLPPWNPLLSRLSSGCIEKARKWANVLLPVELKGEITEGEKCRSWNNSTAISPVFSSQFLPCAVFLSGSQSAFLFLGLYRAFHRLKMRSL